MMKWAIRHIPSGLWFDGSDWTGNLSQARLFEHQYDALDAYGQAQAAGLACASPPYELVPMALQYAPCGAPVRCL